MSSHAYLLDNSQPVAMRRMATLSRLFDGATRRALGEIGAAPGWHCLEVGGGGGSVAHWLAERVAPSGTVLCTDIDPRHIPDGPANLRVVRHDIVRDELPDAGFDLIHARLVLIHVPQRVEVLARLIASLKPGGWLVIEDFDTASVVPGDASAAPGEVQLATAAAMRVYMGRGGNDSRFARTLYGRFAAAGLTELSAEARLLIFDARNGGADLMRMNFEQLAAPLIAAGLVTEEQVRADVERVAAADFWAPSPLMWTVAGRKPAT